MELKSGKRNKGKIIFILGATATGKSKLSVDLATRFPAEIINSDKIQVYKGLEIATNTIPEVERQGVPHHLLEIIDDPEADFSTQDFCDLAIKAINKVLENGHIPIIVGCSNTYIEALVEHPKIDLKSNYDCCFLWVDVSLPVLYNRARERVDEMVKLGLINQLRDFYVPGADYTRGIRRTIGVAEMVPFIEAERSNASEDHKSALLKSAIEETKERTCKLASRQRKKIVRFVEELGWKIHRIDATPVFEKGVTDHQSWEELVMAPSLAIVNAFSRND